MNVIVCCEMAPAATYRTGDLPLTRRLLYRLSYAGLQKQKPPFGGLCHLTYGMGSSYPLRAMVKGLSNADSSKSPSDVNPRRFYREFTGATFGHWLTDVSRNQSRRVKPYGFCGIYRLFLFFSLGLSVLTSRNMGQPNPEWGRGRFECFGSFCFSPSGILWTS